MLCKNLPTKLSLHLISLYFGRFRQYFNQSIREKNFYFKKGKSPYAATNEWFGWDGGICPEEDRIGRNQSHIQNPIENFKSFESFTPRTPWFSWALIWLHQLLNFIGIFRDILHQVKGWTLFLDDHIVLDSNSKIFFRNVNTGFNSKHHIGL